MKESARFLRIRGIEVRREFKLSMVDGDRKEIVSADGERIRYDFLVLIPPYRGIDALLKSGITDDKGWLPADKNTLQ